MTKVLVAYGSKMGGTAGLADAIGGALRLRDITVDLRPAGEVGDVSGYSGLVVGSAIYSSRWRPDVIRLLSRIAESAPETPVWLFHSGPLGNRSEDSQKLPRKVAGITSSINLVEVRTFGGRLPEKPPGLIARLLARKQAGDFRDFDQVDEWAQSIVAAFKPSETA